ncbi:hypothetical protein DFH08DRAFT_894890 [Mycena albidolilacea]|uniref:MYND-type domain-containing protein n=1 Tax=Mycena albidolilacea TaxID=1033008 RepID=A0AAD6ZBZ0_9AGAR|nr:hypothetical protein DFH08DRAFT_894890 [Mycena albidolilacea]
MSPVGTEPELDPILRLGNIKNLPPLLHRIANAAAQGSLESLRRLRKNLVNASQDDAKLCIPIFYANLDPKGIPSTDELDAATRDDFVVSGLSRAFISLLALKNYEKLPPNILPALWPRSWAWIQCLDRYHWLLPACDTADEINNRLDYFWILDRFYSAEETGASVDQTPGIRVLVAQVWATMLDHIRICGDISGMRQLSYMLRGREKPDYQATPVVEPHHIAHLEELIEGTGGGRDEFAALVVEHIILTSSRADSLGFLAVILIVLQDAQFRRILGEPRVFVSAGILGALVNAICAVNSRGHHEFCTLLDIAFYLVGMWMVSDMSIMIAALEAGLLRAIVSCSADYPRMNKVHGILQQLPEATIHYYVLRAMRNGMKEVEDIVSGAEFVTSPMWDDWKKLADLISERGAIQNRCDSGIHALLRACDNVVCGAIRDKNTFRRCSGCLRHYYCSEACQRSDWYAGGHRQNCSTFCDCKVRLPTRAQNFIRTLLHTDYLAQKHTIFLLQVEFLAAHPNQPFYVGFDYTDGRAVVRVYALEDSGGPWGVPRDQCNNEHLMRTERGGGRMVLHRVFVSVGEASYMRWFPLRMTSSVLETGVRRLARELEGTQRSDFDAIRPRLMQQIVALDAAAMGKVLETH